MRELDVRELRDAAKMLAIKSCTVMTPDIKQAFIDAKAREITPVALNVLDALLENGRLAEENATPLCQDTGMALIFLEIGQDVHLGGGDVYEAINAGIAEGYTLGYLRKSVVSDPVFLRENTQNNTPAVIHTSIIPGDKVHMKFGAKGFGSENKSRLKMFQPSDGLDGIREFFIETIRLAGPNSCPPLVVGVGIGGTFEKAALLAKEAALRDVGSYNANPLYKDLEVELTELANAEGIGPEGLGGYTTAFAVNIEYFPTHIAGLPVAINTNCHSARHYHVTI